MTYRHQNTGAKILIHSSIWYAPVLVPLIVMCAAKEDRELRQLSCQALFFHLLFFFIPFVFFLSFGGLLFLNLLVNALPILVAILTGVIALCVLYFIVPAVGILKALQEKPFNYPISSWFIKL